METLPPDITRKIIEPTLRYPNPKGWSAREDRKDFLKLRLVSKAWCTSINNCTGLWTLLCGPPKIIATSVHFLMSCKKKGKKCGRSSHYRESTLGVKHVTHRDVLTAAVKKRKNILQRREKSIRKKRRELAFELETVKEDFKDIEENYF